MKLVRRFVAPLVVVAVLVVTVVNCVGLLPIDDRPCPCANGWTCVVSRCVPEGYPDDAGINDSAVLDAQFPSDGGAVDAPFPSDAGTVDAPFPFDAGAVDAPFPSDAGAVDAPFPSDAGAVDAPFPFDAGAQQDAPAVPFDTGLSTPPR